MTLHRVRVAVIILGIALSLLALRLDDRRLTWVAIGVLAVALLLGFVTRPRRSAEPPADAS